MAGRKASIHWANIPLFSLKALSPFYLERRRCFGDRDLHRQEQQAGICRMLRRAEEISGILSNSVLQQIRASRMTVDEVRHVAYLSLKQRVKELITATDFPITRL